MSDGFPKVLRDPVHNLIHFRDHKNDKLLWRLINTREFQRLRRIKQLGMSEFVYPGANHSRFAHSIGVMHMARKFLARIETWEKITPLQEAIVLCAALLHDLGHGPFSHAFERITDDNHERRTIEIIRSKRTEVNRVLSGYSKHLPEYVIQMIDKSLGSKKSVLPRYMLSIVSSRLDADRFDYLLRDTYATGTSYGTFDPNWLILNLFPDKNGEGLYLGKKALLAVEMYIFARHHMYQSVYYHKTTRSAEVILDALFKRFKQKLQASSGKFTLDGCPHALKELVA